MTVSPLSHIQAQAKDMGWGWLLFQTGEEK
jgi:hypothetical protein